MTRSDHSVVHFDTKIAIVLDEGLASWQKVNVTAFLMSQLAVTRRADGQPILVANRCNGQACHGGNLNSVGVDPKLAS